MGVLSNFRGSRVAHNAQGGEELPTLANGSSSSLVPKKKWSNFLPLFVALVVIAEIAFLGRLDMAKNAAMFDSLADMFHKSSPATTEFEMIGDGDLVIEKPHERLAEAEETCEEWLGKQDAVNYSRDFEKDPVLVSGADKVSLLIVNWLHIYSWF